MESTTAISNLPVGDYHSLIWFVALAVVGAFVPIVWSLSKLIQSKINKPEQNDLSSLSKQMQGLAQQIEKLVDSVDRSQPNRLSKATADVIFGHIMKTYICHSVFDMHKRIVKNTAICDFQTGGYEKAVYEWSQYALSLAGRAETVFSQLFDYNTGRMIVDFFGERGPESFFRHLVTSLLGVEHANCQARLDLEDIPWSDEEIQSRLDHVHSRVWGDFKQFTLGKKGINGWSTDYEPFQTPKNGVELL
jgi:hypothetical protein